MELTVRSLYTRGAPPDSVVEAARLAQEAKRPLSIRYNCTVGRVDNSTFPAWKGVSYTLEVATLQDGLVVQEVVAKFFEAVSTGRVPELLARLDGFVRGTDGGA